MVIPTVYGTDGRQLYLHGSVASQSLAADAPVCVTVTLVDGLVLARSVFEHAVNYRSAMIYAVPRVVDDPAEKLAGLRCVSEHVAPGQWEYTRQPSRKELAATRLLALDLAEASVKIRTGPPDDAGSPDAALGLWAGELPLQARWQQPVPDPALPAGQPVPPHIQALAGTPAYQAGRPAPRPSRVPARRLRRMLPCWPRRAGAAAIAAEIACRVAGGAMTSSTMPSATARSRPPRPPARARRPPRPGDRHLRARPGEHPGGAQRPRVHRDAGPAAGPAGHQRHPRNRGLGERVHQLGPAPPGAVPLWPAPGANPGTSATTTSGTPKASHILTKRAAFRHLPRPGRRRASGGYWPPRRRSGCPGGPGPSRCSAPSGGAAPRAGRPAGGSAAGGRRRRRGPRRAARRPRRRRAAARRPRPAPGGPAARPGRGPRPAPRRRCRRRSARRRAGGCPAPGRRAAPGRRPRRLRRGRGRTRGRRCCPARTR